MKNNLQVVSVVGMNEDAQEAADEACQKMFEAINDSEFDIVTNVTSSTFSTKVENSYSIRKMFVHTITALVGRTEAA